MLTYGLCGLLCVTVSSDGSQAITLVSPAWSLSKARGGEGETRPESQPRGRSLPSFWLNPLCCSLWPPVGSPPPSVGSGWATELSINKGSWRLSPQLRGQGWGGRWCLNFKATEGFRPIKLSFASRKSFRRPGGCQRPALELPCPPHCPPRPGWQHPVPRK